MPSILSDDNGQWRRITLNRPERLNAFNDDMHRALLGALEDASAAPECRAILLTGSGRAFCAGQDLNDRAGDDANTADLGATIEQFYNPLIRCIRSLPKPVICAVNGVAAGAGANLALACDIVLAGRSAKFIQAFVKIGLVPDSGGTYFLPRLIGDARARALCMTGEALPAETAAAWGLIWKCIDDADLLREAEVLTHHVAAQPTQALAMIKQAFAASATNALDEQLNLERDLQRRAGQTPDYQEGVRAFIEKRAPAFGNSRGGGRPL